MTRVTVRPEEIGPGFYVAFGSDLGVVGFFKVVSYGGTKEHPGPFLWGLSRWKGAIAYRTRGLELSRWLAEQPAGVQYRRDRDRSGWPPDATLPGLEAEAQNWRAIRDLVRELDAELRGPGPGMADDDILDVVSQVLRRKAKQERLARGG